MSGNRVSCHESQIQLVELYVHNLNHCNGHLIVLCHSDLRLPVKKMLKVALVILGCSQESIYTHSTLPSLLRDSRVDLYVYAMHIILDHSSQ